MKFLSIMPALWVIMKRPYLIVPYFGVIFFSLYLLAGTKSTGFIPFYLVCNTILYLEICFYLTFFSGTDPIFLLGVDLRKIHGFFLTSIIIQLVVTAFVTHCTIIFNDDLSVLFFIQTMTMAICQNAFKYLAFSGFALHLMTESPDIPRITVERFGKDLCKVVAQKLN